MHLIITLATFGDDVNGTFMDFKRLIKLEIPEGTLSIKCSRALSKAKSIVIVLIKGNEWFL